MFSLSDTEITQTNPSLINDQSSVFQKNDVLRFDIRYFKAFLAAAETQNFTLAAKQTCMTQSGISQQIAKLEAQLDVKLFTRRGKNVLLTHAGKKLVKYVEKYMALINHLIIDVRDSTSFLNGEILLAMPQSCAMCSKFSAFLNYKKKFPNLTLNIKFLPIDEIGQSISQGTVDFAFINKKLKNPQIETIKLCREEYAMVSSKANNTRIDGSDFTIQDNFIIYPDMESYLSPWLSHHNIDEMTFKARHLKAANKVNTIFGAIKMVVEGLGTSIFPRHCVQPYIEKKQLVEIRVPDKTLLNKYVYISYHKQLQQNYAIVQMVQSLLQEINCCVN